MFSLFRRKKPKATIPPELKALFERTTKGMSWAAALADVAAQHAKNIKAGRSPFPVMEAEDVTTVTRWHHLRLEACLGAVRYGQGSLGNLADFQTQRAALAALLDQRAHLQFPQPSGDAMAHSVQGMWQAYLYLGEAGTKVADPTTDRFLLRGRSITDELEREARVAQRWWSEHGDGPEALGPDMPPTLFELFFDDLNRKSKSIVLTKLLGPDHAKGGAEFVEEMRKARGEADAAQLRQFLDVVREAENPDRAFERTAALPIAGYF